MRMFNQKTLAALALAIFQLMFLPTQGISPCSYVIGLETQNTHTKFEYIDPNDCPWCSNEYDLTVRGGEDCNLRILAVGGGGSGGCNGPAGGGSGYIQYLTIPITDTHINVNVKLGVGRAGEASNFTIDSLPKPFHYVVSL